MAIINSTAAMTMMTDCLETLEVEKNTTVDNTTQLHVHVFNCSQTGPLLASPGITTLTYISFGIIWGFVLLGVFGNLLTLTVTIKFRDTLKGHDILIISLAVCDCAAVIMTPPNHPTVYEVIGRDITATTTAGCKLFFGIWSSLVVSSTAIVVIISIERFVAVWLPLRAKILLSRQRILRSLCVSVAVCFSVYVTLSILYSEIQDGLCYPNMDGSVYSTVLRQIPDTTVYNILIAVPLLTAVLILCTLTPMTIGKLIKQRANRRRLTNSDDTSDGLTRITLKLTAVVVVFMTLVCCPGVVGSIIGMSGINVHDLRIVHSVIIYLFLVNHSTNFIIYNMFDYEFRANVARLFSAMIAKDTIPTVAIELTRN